MSEETTESTGTAAPESTGVAAPEAGKRPVFLTVICILSFIAAGFGILGYITVLTAMGAASAIAGAGMDALEGMEGMEGMEELSSAMPSMGLTWAYIIVGFLTTIVALMGVLKMWKLKKQGFMLYAGASVVSVIMGIVYSGFSVVGIVITGAFIAMYYINLKHMTD